MRNFKAFNYLVLADSQLPFLPVYVIGMYDCYSTTFPQTVNDIVEIWIPFRFGQKKLWETWALSKCTEEWFI